MNEKLASGLSTRHVQYILAVLRSALNSAFKDSLVARNVAALVRPPRVQAKEVCPLTPEEARRFLDSIRGHRLEALFTVAVLLGLRQGEALGLRWRDIDVEEGTLRVRYALQRLKISNNRVKSVNRVAGSSPNQGADRAKGVNGVEKSAFHLVEPKTRQSRRTIALPQATLTALSEHKALQSQERELAGSTWNTPVLVVDGEPEPVSPVAVNVAVNPEREKVN
jgi:integrase